MSALLNRIRSLVQAGHYRISFHAYERLEKHGILPTQIIKSLESVTIVEEYPDANRGPSILVLLRDQERKPIHAVWGLPKDGTNIAVMITAYRPDPAIWNSDFMTRKTR